MVSTENENNIYTKKNHSHRKVFKQNFSFHVNESIIHIFQRVQQN